MAFFKPNKSVALDRRTFLRGLGTVAVALPVLDIMCNSHGEAMADGKPIPKRYLVCFNGQSLGGDGDPVHNMYAPDKIGADYDLKLALAPLAAVKDVVSVVSGLKIPWANGGPIPAGGRSDDHHIQSLCPLFTGMRNTAPKNGKLMGPSSDQIVAAAIAGDTTFKSLVYRVQAEWYLDVSAPYGRDIMSAKKDSSGALITIPATVSPRTAYDSLFTGFKPPDPKAAAREVFLLKQRQSILDIVRGSGDKLMTKLGASDKIRLQRHLDELRDLEKRVAAIPPAVTATCKQLGDPGADPPIGGNQPSTGGTTDFDNTKGYSNEDKRAALMCDLIAMAFTCDLTRAGSLMFTMAQSHMNTFPLLGYPYDLHEVGHSMGKTKNVSEGIAWHVKHFARLISTLRATKEGTGTVLDNTVLTLIHEGGHGHDPEASKENSGHSTENMACLIAGGTACGLKQGQHVVAKDKHPGNVLNSAMKAVGVDQNLGEVIGVIPELFV